MTAAAIAPRARDAVIWEAAPAEPTTARPFLTAQWRDFLMLSYEVDPRILAPHVPPGTEIDLWRGGAYVSVVGFVFARPRLFGMPIPLHSEFAEVNLRFYVRRRVGDAWRRGVVFLRELVARRAVALVARLGYGERFGRVPMSYAIERRATKNAHDPPLRIEFAWTNRRRRNVLAATPIGRVRPPEPESLDEFAVEHYYAYTATRRGPALEYLVTHPPWQVAATETAEFNCDVAAQYGAKYAEFLRGEPASAFWATGSPVRVYRGARV